MFGLWMINRIKQVVACVCCMACSGPVLIIISIVVLTDENTRNADIDSWKASIAEFETSGGRALMLATTASLGTTQLTLVENNVAVSGSQDNIPSTTSLELEAYNEPLYDWSFSTAINGTRNSTVTPSSTPIAKTTTTSVTCTKSYCSTGCSSSSSSSSSSSYTCSNMASRACSGGTYSGSSSCRSGTYCGTCTRDVYLLAVCVPMALPASATAGWTASRRRRSCEYPFGDNQYYSSSYASYVEVKLMSENDPYITLEQATGGDRDFGMTEATQRRSGTILLVAGIVITIGMYGALAFVVKRFMMPTLNDQSGATMNSPPVNPIDTIHVSSGPMPQYPSQPQQQQQQEPVIYGSANLQQPVDGQPVYPAPPPGYVQTHPQPGVSGGDAYPQPPQQNPYSQPQQPGGHGLSYAAGLPPPEFGLGKESSLALHCA